MGRSDQDAPRGYHIEGLDRGLRVLSMFSELRREMRMSDIAEHTGLPTPTVFRILRTLENRGYVERLKNGAFIPGAAVLSLGFAALQGSDLAQTSEVPLRQLADDLGETVNLGVLVGHQVLYLQRIRNADLIAANIQVGSLLPAVSTSIGKLLLAYQPVAKLRAEMDAGAFKSAWSGPRAAASLDELLPQLAIIRERGWAVQDEELASGLRSISAPIMDATGQVLAGINVAVSAARWSLADLESRALDRLRATTSQISQRLGYAGPAGAPPRPGGR